MEPPSCETQNCNSWTIKRPNAKDVKIKIRLEAYYSTDEFMAKYCGTHWLTKWLEWNFIIRINGESERMD